MIKVWLDDDLIHRKAPEGWVHVTTVDEAMKLLDAGNVSHLSLDHDLGENQKTGYDLMNWIEKRYMVQDIKPPVMNLHSANPVGCKNMQVVIDKLHDMMKSIG